MLPILFTTGLVLSALAAWALVGPLASIVTALVLLVVFGDLVVAAWTNRRVRVQTGAEAIVGCSGTVLDTETATGSVWRGRVQIGGEIWNASAAEGALGVGDQVRVVAIDGLLLHVVGSGT